MIDLHLSAFAPRWRFLYAVRIDAYILATGGTEKFCFHFLQRRDFENAKYPGGKISPLIYYYNRQGAKWPGARTGNKKSSKSFSDLLLSLVAGGGWYSVLKV